MMIQRVIKTANIGKVTLRSLSFNGRSPATDPLWSFVDLFVVVVVKADDGPAVGAANNTQSFIKLHF